MTKIKTNGDRIIIDGHANTREECETITLFCNALKQSKDFRTIKYESGYAEFEKIGKSEDLKFADSVDDPVGTIPAGTYKFKDSISLPSADITQSITFKYTQYGQNYTATSMNIQSSGVIYYKGTTTVTAFQGTWQSTAQTITLETAQNVSSSFYTWFRENAQCLLEAGMYKWVDYPETPTINFNTNFEFSDDINSFTGMYINSYPKLVYKTLNGDEEIFDYLDSDWLGVTSGKVILSSSQYVDYDFYNYAINGKQLIKKVQIKGKWKFNATLTGIEKSTSYIITEVSFKYGTRQCSKIRNGNRYLAFYFNDTKAYDDVYNSNTNLWIYEDDGGATIDFGSAEQDVPQSFYTWLVANANEIQPSIIQRGFYKFATSPTAPSSNLSQDISFVSNKIEYKSIKPFSTGPIQYIKLNGDIQTVKLSAGWASTSYQGIIVKQDTEVDGEFKTWFDANTTTYDEWDLRINGKPTGKWNGKDISHLILYGVSFKIRQPYTITTNLTNITADSENPTTIRKGETKTLKFYIADGYDYPDDVTVDGAEYRWEIKDTSTTTETWLLNETLTNVSLETTIINFTSNGVTYDRIMRLYNTEVSANELDYGDLGVEPFAIPYENGAWTDNAYRTITFETAPTGNLLTWLQANGTKQ